MTVDPAAEAALDGAVVVDVRGLRCPVPVIELARTVAATAPGSVVAVLSDDPASAADVPAWCRMRGSSYLGRTPAPDGMGGAAYLVRVG